MIKQILLYLIFFFALFFLTYHIHLNYIDNYEIILPFSLQKVYIFHLVFSLMICIHFQLFSTVDKLSSQLGFIYLVALLLKIVLFLIIFYEPIFSEEKLTLSASISLIISMIIFLLTEALFVIKIINKNDAK